MRFSLLRYVPGEILREGVGEVFLEKVLDVLFIEALVLLLADLEDDRLVLDLELELEVILALLLFRLLLMVGDQAQSDGC